MCGCLRGVGVAVCGPSQAAGINVSGFVLNGGERVDWVLQQSEAMSGVFKL